MTLLPAWSTESTPAFKEQAKRELHEDPEGKVAALKELRKLINEEDGFEPLTDDRFLCRFLRARKYDVNRAFGTLKNFYAYKASYSGSLTDFLPSDLKIVLEMNKVFIPPKRCHKGTGVLVLFPGSFDVDEASYEQLFAATLLSSEIGIETEGSQVCGCTLIVDFKGMGLSKARFFANPVLLSRMLRGLQDCWPYRMKSIHVTNEPAYMSIIYSIVKPMLSKKLRDRVHFHGDNMKTLHEYVPAENLPKELGGQLGEKDFTDFKSLVYQNEHLLERVNKYVYQGEKYPTKSIAKAGTTDINVELIVPKTLQNI